MCIRDSRGASASVSARVQEPPQDLQECVCGKNHKNATGRPKPHPWRVQEPPQDLQECVCNNRDNLLLRRHLSRTQKRDKLRSSYTLASAARVQEPPQDLQECVCNNRDNPLWASMFADSEAMPPGRFNRLRPLISCAAAAQIAWWLAFFPPDRFTFVFAAQLHSDAGLLQVRLPTYLPYLLLHSDAGLLQVRLPPH